jgi:hypothetical protein
MNYEAIVINRIPYSVETNLNLNSYPYFTWEGDNGKRISAYRINSYMLDMEFYFEGTSSWYGASYCIDGRPKCSKDFYNKQIKGKTANSSDEILKWKLEFFGWDFAFSKSEDSFSNINKMMEGFKNNSLNETGV